MPHTLNMTLIAHAELEDRPGMKLALHETGGRFYLYVASYWHSGWTILDVTQPSAPRHVRFIPGPPNTSTEQVQAADGLLVTGLYPFPDEFNLCPDADGGPGQEGILLWDLADPEDPKVISHWQSGATGTHRNYYDGGDVIHAATTLPGFKGELYGAIDISDREHPTLIGHWGWPGQHWENGEHFSAHDQAKAHNSHLKTPSGTEYPIWLHAVYADEGRAYGAWSRGGMAILDVADPSAPSLLGSLSFYPPLGSDIAVHSVVPVAGRGIAIVNSEQLLEPAAEPLNFVAAVDVRDPADPRLISIFPTPEPPDGYGYPDFALRGRFGPHNQHQPQHQPCLAPTGDYVFITYFLGGVQVFDIANPRLPKIAGYYIPDDPGRRIGPLPAGELVPLAEDVLVDRRGFVYLTERNSGVHILTFDPPGSPRRRIDLSEYPGDTSANGRGTR